MPFAFFQVSSPPRGRNGLHRSELRSPATPCSSEVTALLVDVPDAGTGE